MPPQVRQSLSSRKPARFFSATATSEQRRAIYIAGWDGLRIPGAGSDSAPWTWQRAGPSRLALSFTVAVTFALIAAWAPTRAEPDVAIRFALFLSLSVITYETFIGANGGFTFLWFYVLPIGMFFLLGQREGALWFSASALILAWLLFVVDHRETPGGAVCTIALATFTLLGILGFGLERARFRLSQVLEQEKIALEKGLADLEALYGLVPICASCKSVRDDRGYWHDIEIYLSKHSAVELQAAFCPSCKQDGHAPPKGERQPLSSVTSRAERADPQLEHARRRRIYFHLGLGVLIPFLGYFGVVDLLAGRWFEAALIFGLVLLLTACLLVMRVKQVDRAVYQTAAGASMLVMAFDLHLGAYDGYSVLWLYSFPAFTIFVLGARGLAMVPGDLFIVGLQPLAAHRVPLSHRHVQPLSHHLCLGDRHGLWSGSHSTPGP